MKNAITIILLMLAGCSDQNDLKQTVITFNLYNSPPSITSHTIDNQEDKLVVWNADFHNKPSATSSALGDVHGSMLIIKATKELEDRLTNLEFDWDNSKDSLLISGIHAYPADKAETDTPIHRAIIGGTGKFIGARGEITSSRLDGGWYKHEISLVQ